MKKILSCVKNDILHTICERDERIKMALGDTIKGIKEKVVQEVEEIKQEVEREEEERRKKAKQEADGEKDKT